MILGNGLAMNWFYAKQIHLDIRRFWNEILHISITVGICLVVGYMGNLIFASNSLVIFISKVLAYTIIYITGIYYFSMSNDEKHKVMNGFKQIHDKIS